MILPSLILSLAEKLGKLIVKTVLQLFAWPIYGCINYIYGIYNVFKYVYQNVSDSAIAILDFVRNFRKNVLVSLLTIVLLAVLIIVAFLLGKTFNFIFEKIHPNAPLKQSTKKYSWPAYIICIGTALIPAQQYLRFMICGLQYSSNNFLGLLDTFAMIIEPFPLPVRICLWHLYMLAYIGVSVGVVYFSYVHGFKRFFLSTSQDKLAQNAFDSIYFTETRKRFITLMLVLQMFGWILFNHSDRQKAR